MYDLPCIVVCSAQMASETFASRKQDLRERQSEVDAQARFLDNEGANNKEVESRIAYYDREVVSVEPRMHGLVNTQDHVWDLVG